MLRILLLAPLCVLAALGHEPVAAARQPVPGAPAGLLERPIGLRPGIGRAHDEVTTSSPAAQAAYDQGLSFLHAYAWVDAARSFHEALRADGAVALAHVGLSYACAELGLPDEARAAIGRARAMAARVSDRERRQIAAREKQMAAEADPRDAALLREYRAALDEAVAAYPSNAEFLLKRGLAESPDPADRGAGAGASAVPYFERALEAGADSARHYLAQAADNAGRVDEALAHAAAFAAAAPEAPQALHLHGLALRRAGRITDAMAAFESADRMLRAAADREKAALDLDDRHARNLDQLALAYWSLGRVRQAEAALKESFALGSRHLVQVVDKREWPAFLRARNRPAEAAEAAAALVAHPHPVVQAAGHIEAGFTFLAVNRSADGGAASNLALRALKEATGRQDLVVIEFEALQGEFRLRTAQRERGREQIEGAVRKWQALRGSAAWSRALFRIEALARAAMSVGDWTLAARLGELMAEHDSAYAGTHYTLALIARHDGDEAAARREFDLALEAWRSADKDLPELAAARRR